MLKYILIIGDGMADNPVEELGGKTPIEYAAIKNIDRLASAGIVGSVKTCPEELPPGSDTAILAIFGCDPRKFYTGRAPLEAAATGVMLEPGDVAFRCNMVTISDEDVPFEKKRILSHSAGAIEGELSVEIINRLFSDPKFAECAEKAGLSIYPAPSFRHIAVQKNVDAKGIKLSPPHDYLGGEIGSLLPHGCKDASTLKELMLLAHEILNGDPINKKRRAEGKMPANGIWFWAEGTAVKLPNFVEQYGKTGGVISAVPLCHGIAALVGLEKITVDGATGELDTNYEGKVDAALEVLKNNDFAAIHIEAPDECTHNGDLQGKLQGIEWIDTRVVAPLVEKLGAANYDYRILIVSDHKTLTSTRGHDGTPVPYLIYDSRLDRKTDAVYCERDGEKGPYLPEGILLMKELFEG